MERSSNSEKISAAILSPSPVFRNALKNHVVGSQLAEINISVDAHCLAEDDQPTRQLIEACPDIVFVDMEDQRAGIRTIGILHSVLPEKWLCAFGAPDDSQLIIESMSAGARDFLPTPVIAPNVSLALRRYIEERERSRAIPGNRGRVYAVLSAKEGAGATSVAINLSVVLAAVPETRVALVDLNSPGDLATYLNIHARAGVEDALTVPKLDNSLLETFMSNFSNVSLLPAFRTHELNNGPVARLIKTLAAGYSHCFLDVPGKLPPEVLQTVLQLSDVVLVVITAEVSVLWRTQLFLNSAANLKDSNKFRVILNRGGSWNGIEAGEIEKVLDRPVSWVLPNDYRTAVRAIHNANTIVAERRSRIAESYRKLAANLTGISLDNPPKSFRMKASVPPISSGWPVLRRTGS